MNKKFEKGIKRISELKEKETIDKFNPLQKSCRIYHLHRI